MISYHYGDCMVLLLIPNHLMGLETRVVHGLDCLLLHKSRPRQRAICGVVICEHLLWNIQHNGDNKSEHTLEKFAWNVLNFPLFSMSL